MLDSILAGFWTFLGYSWWFWALLILLPAASDAWRAWRQKKFEHEIKWLFLEMKIPRETLKSPLAMEQVFMQLFYLKNYAGDIRETWWYGEVTLWHSFEIASLNGEIHFYLRTPKVYRNLTEAAIFAFYPDIELVETEDYLKQYPATIQELYRDGMALYGSEIKLNKSGAYPIRSYVDFESPDENKQYDPISTFLELLAKLQSGQMAAIQYLISPVAGPHDKHTIEGYHKEVIRLRERKNEEAENGHGAASMSASFPGGIMPALEVAAEDADPAQVKALRKAVLSRTPGETNIIEAIEDNLSRPMFNVVIRYIYISKTELYDNHYPRRAMAGTFNQFNGVDINGFSRNKNTSTSGKLWEWPIVFPEIRYERRRQKIYHDFRHREIPAHTFFGKILMHATWQIKNKESWEYKPQWGSHFLHLNVRSLATLFHLPTYMTLTGPHIKRVDSRKGGPPAGMAIFGDEGQIDKFK